MCQALSQFGENYELISLVLPGRDRKACKNKFKAEDKRNSGRIAFSLKNRQPYGEVPSMILYTHSLTIVADMATLSRMTGKDFSGPTPDIRAPAPLRIPESAEKPMSQSRVAEVRHAPAPVVKRAPATPADVEILGDVEELSLNDGDVSSLS